MHLGRESALPLFVASVGANDTDHAFALNDLTILAKLLYRCSNFHIQIVCVFTIIRPTDKS
jgi:hypothetical protein